MMNTNLQRFKYLVADFIAAAFSWSFFFLFRKWYLEPKKFGSAVNIELNDTFYLGLFIIPALWILLYTLTGYYQYPYRKSRLKEFGETFIISLIGTTILFFVLLLDDEIPSYKSYYISITTLFTTHFLSTAILRLIISSNTAHKIHNRIIGFKTIIIGSNENALNLYQELENMEKSSGFKLVGFVNHNGNHDHLLEAYLPHLGNTDNVKNIIKNHQIEEVIIAIESSEHEGIKNIIHLLEGENISLKIIPNMYDILTGQVKMSAIFGAPLIEINHERNFTNF